MRKYKVFLGGLAWEYDLGIQEGTREEIEEKWTEEVGRLALKIVGNGYYALK